MNQDTTAVIARIAALREIADNHPPLVYHPRPEVAPDSPEMLEFEEVDQRTRDASRRVEAALDELNVIYRQMEATPDLPEDILIHLLRVRCLDQGSANWCDKIRSLGGPVMTDAWLFGYRMDRLLGRERKIDKRVRAALILEDANGKPRKSRAA